MPEPRNPLDPEQGPIAPGGGYGGGFDLAAADAETLEKSPSHPQASASSTARRGSGSVGNSGGWGRRRSRKREIGTEPWTRFPSAFSAGTVPCRNRAARNCTGCIPRKEVDDLVVDPLELEHQPRRPGGV